MENGKEKGSTAKNGQVKRIALLKHLQQGLENLECVLQACVQAGNWELFEGNEELQILWRQFCDQIYQGNNQPAVLHASAMMKIIGPAVVAANFRAAVFCGHFFPNESRLMIIRERWKEFRRDINSGDSTRIVRALKAYLENALAYLAPKQLLSQSG